MAEHVKLDLSSPDFVEEFANAERAVQDQVQKTIEKISGMTWQQVYMDKGLRWEKIYSLDPPEGVDSLYSFRISRSCRGIGYRNKGFMVILTFSADHDLAYGKK